MPSQSRPRSPNIQHYRPQLTSVLSFSHRVTGGLLSLGAMLLVGWLVAAAIGAGAYSEMQGFIGSWPGRILMFTWTFSLFFHLCSGIRHLFWDAGYGFELRTIYLSGWAVVAASLLLTLVAWTVVTGLPG